MKKTIYIFSNGRLKRKDNTLFFETKDGNKSYIPVENVKEIYAFGEIDLNSKILNFLSQKEMILHYFNYYGYYAGSFYPREHYNSGFMILRQVEHYQDNQKRLLIAKKIVEGAAKNTLKILKYHNRRGKNINTPIEEIEGFYQLSMEQENIEQLMAFEGQIKQTYFKAFSTIIDNPEFQFESRTRRPPKDYINTLISFSNSVLYTQVLSEIYQTHLDPRIGYLHTTNFRRFTLNLDIAEIFKLVIGDRTIFSVLNKRIITEKDFDKNFDGIILKEKILAAFGRKIEANNKTFRFEKKCKL